MLTLKKVKELVGAPSHAKRTPSPKMLYEEGIVLLRREFDQGSHLTVYNSGYVLFSAGKRNTVFHIHDCCGDYAYDAAEGKGDVIEEEYFENCEWHIRALFEGERKMEDARYKALDAQYAKEQDALEIEIAELEKAVTGYEQSQKSAEKFIALIDKYENFDTLTNTMLNEFIEKILVHERARKGSQDTTQEIEIYFNFLGRYIPPSLQPVPLTPEEQEELRKKEERKDRLHQNLSLIHI